MLELSRQIAAYEKMQPALEMDHFGKWAVFYDEKLVDTYESVEVAIDNASLRFGRGPYLIRQIGAAPISIPASLLYR